MELTRAQEQRIAQLEEFFNAETNQKLDAIIGMLSRLLGNQRSDDQSTLNRSTTPTMKAMGSRSDHFDRSGNDRRFGEIREGLVHKTILKENSTPQFQVPMANSEIVKSIEPGKVDLGLENEEYVVLNENLEQEWVQKKVKTNFEADGDVERGQKMISDTETSCAHKVLVKMPSKEKCLKHLKAWKFKFKSTSKRSRLMDDKISFVDATVLLNTGPKETIWDCVKKEIKETLAACGKKRVDRFKLIEEKKSRLEVLDLHQTFMCHQSGRVWEPGGLPNKMDLWDWFGTELKACRESQQVERFLYSLMQVVKRNLEFKTFERNKTFSDSDIASFIGLEICGFETKKHVLLLMKRANRVWECGELLATPVYHKWLEKKKLRNVEAGVKQDKNRFSGDVGAKVFMAAEELHLLQDVFEWVKELLLKTSLISPQVMRNTKRKFTKQWMFKFRKKKIDQWLGYNLIVAYLRNKKTWAKLSVRELDNLTWEEDASDESWSTSRIKPGEAMITCKNLLEKSYDKNVEIVGWSKSPGCSEISCEVDAFGDQESTKFRKFDVTKILVKWVNGPTEEATWEFSVDFQKKYLDFETETLRSRFCKGGRCDTVWYVWASRVNIRN